MTYAAGSRQLAGLRLLSHYEGDEERDRGDNQQGLRPPISQNLRDDKREYQQRRHSHTHQVALIYDRTVQRYQYQEQKVDRNDCQYQP